MIYSLLFIYFNFFITLSSIIIKPKLCINCKFFTKDFFSSNEFGKCTLYPIQRDNIDFLVVGIKKKKNDFYYCSTSRKFNDMCGNEGKYFVKKNNNIFKWEKE